MASVNWPAQAFDYAKKFIKSMNLETVAFQILDDTNKYLWMAGPWRWTLADLSAISLVSNTQDYLITLPSDFLYFFSAYISTSDGDVPRQLNVVPFLPFGGKLGLPSEMALVSGSAGSVNANLRFSPKPGTLDSNTNVFTLYKKLAPVFTPANIYTAGIQIFPDEWFWVYISGVLYFSYLYADDQRAGGAQIDPTSGKVTYTGQRGVFEANIQVMKDREKLPSTPPSITDPKETK